MTTALKNQTKSVFILGAGASNHLGYPLGKELVEDIIRNYDHSNMLNCSNHAVDVFKRMLKQSSLLSIDAFLEYTSSFKDDDIDYLEIGLSAIVKQLIIKENIEILNDPKNNWYFDFWNRIHRDIDKLFDGSVAFVTFNYDLSLEQFFYLAIKASKFGNALSQERHEELSSLVKKIPIIHVYGKLGTLKWQDTTSRFTREYGSLDSDAIRPNIISKISESIKIIRNDNEITSEFQQAQKFIEAATHIYFLGFGYDQMNLNRLRVLENIRHDKVSKISGTAKRLGFAERKKVLSHFHPLVSQSFQFGAEDDGIIEFLKNKFENL